MYKQYLLREDAILRVMGGSSNYLSIDELISEAIRRDVLAASLMARLEAAGLRVGRVALVLGNLAGSVDSEETGTGSGGRAEDGDGDVVPAGQEVAKVLAEIAAVEAALGVLVEVVGRGVGDGAGGTDVGDHHVLAIIVDLENVTGQEAVGDGKDRQVLAVHNEGLECKGISIAISEGVVSIVHHQVDAGTLLRARADAGPIGNTGAARAGVAVTLLLCEGSRDEGAGGEDQRPELHGAGLLWVGLAAWVTPSVYILARTPPMAVHLFMRPTRPKRG